MPAPEILTGKSVDPTRSDGRLQDLQVMVITTLRSVTQLVIWRIFTAQIEINQTGERAVEDWRRPLIGEPSLHLSPFLTASLGDCCVVIGVDLELNDRRTVDER